MSLAFCIRKAGSNSSHAKEPYASASTAKTIVSRGTYESTAEGEFEHILARSYLTQKKEHLKLFLSRPSTLVLFEFSDQV